MKTTFKYDHYYKYDEVKSNLEYFEKTYPNLCKLDVNTVTPENRNQYVITITNLKTGDALNKPALYIDGNIHAGEVTSTMCAMHTIDYLLTNYGIEQEVTKLLDTKTFYIIPRVTPDGSEKYLTTPYTLRSAPRDYLTKKGGIKDEDLDNDGVIRMMRIKTPYGAWKIDTNNEGSMKLREPSDIDGDFYDIFPEGVLEEYEGDENLKVKKEDWGLDFNRNFPFGWFPDARQPGAGKYPLSNPETKALVDFALAHENIGGAAIGHTSGGLILYPPGTKPEKDAPSLDIKSLKEIANMGKEELDYVPLNIFDSFVSSQENYDSGAFDDWFYQSQGIPAYTMEFWDVDKKAGVPKTWGEKKEDTSKEIERFNAVMTWVKKNAPNYYMDWKEFDHPSFGKVEIGGFNFKFTVQNPPENFLLNECEHDTKFNIRFAKALPSLTIDSLNYEKVSDDVYKISAIIGNLGYLPTNLTDEAIKLETAKPVEVSIEGCEVIAGKEIGEIGNLSGFSRTCTGAFYGNITTFEAAKAKKKVTWLVKNPKTVVISAKQVKAGCAKKTLEIN